MIAGLLALLGPSALPPPPTDDPAPVEPAPAEAGEAAVGTEEAEVVSEPVNPAATTDVPPAPSETPTPNLEKAPPSPEAIARDNSVPPPPPPGKRARWKRPGTKQRFVFEFKLGPYLPEIDNPYDGPGFGPYATIFGRTDKNGKAVKQPLPALMPVVAFEYQFVYLGGPLAIGTQVGFYRDKANALFLEPPSSQLRSKADKVTFGMVPISLLVIYRFELGADFFKVPLVPYMKAGLAYAFWWMKDGAGEIARNTRGEKGRGGVIGWQLNPGIMLRMDFIEPATAKKLDQATGINHTYLFGEFQLTRLRNFGVGNAIDLGDKTFFAGLALEF